MRCLRDVLGFTLLDNKRNEDILRMTGNDIFNGLDMCKGWVVRGHRRVFRCRPVGKKRQPGGVSLCWVDTISSDLS